ncbi:DUF4344 domain-containing metallopeptidase [Noviherbaspirillum pedocola]|uniref:Metallopeptidase n=1 Tax=Noviherbaspirillum pedocola TaxID=2801341 RepID=A0A934SWM9_9BURK|nr:DUF4344 domain-containing metallopeptidase [Noviherbaspirillum pedocola]MBK4736788.1 hypothetical protein [Noviherbaspirillum pedocola]
MKSFLLLCLTLAVHAFAAAGAIPTVELLWTGKAVPFYGNASDEEQQKVMVAVRSDHMAERMAAIAQGFRLRSNIAVGFASCGQPNAAFIPQKQVLVICTEFLELILQEVKADQKLTSRLDKTQLVTWIRGVIWGVYFHELAHALIHVNGINVTGREEDVADQFSLWYAVNYVDLAKQPIVTPVVWFWRALAKRHDIGEMSDDALRNILANEHGLDDQRTYNVACWALGANPERGSKTAQFVGLPELRAARCPSEYAALNAAMRNHFFKYIKPRRN